MTDNMLRQNSQKTLRHAGAENSCYPSRLNGLANVRRNQKQTAKRKKQRQNQKPEE